MTSDDEGYTWSTPRPLLQFEIPEGKTHPNAFKKGDAVVLSDGTIVLLTCGQPGGNGQVLYSRDNGDTWVRACKDRGFQVDRFAYYPSACVLADDSIFMVGDHQGFLNDYGPFGAEVVATRFRILDAADGEGIERLPIDGDLHPAWGTRLHTGDDTDETL
ncbi:MAG: exo-alpha-sialidase [Gemmatimonadetes bacterium]|nr:exo-alpha-sialidase [Gemmatimonadota bacterium]